MQFKNKNSSPHQSPSVTASPRGEALGFCKPAGAARALASPFGGGVRAQRRMERVSNDQTARPSQSASLTALPKGEPRNFCKPTLPQKHGGAHQRAGHARPYVTTNWGGTEKITPARESRGRGVAGFCFTSTGLPADREWLPFGRGWRCFWGGGRRLHRSAVLRRTPTAWRGRRSRKCSWHHYSSGCSCPRRR